MKSWKKLTQMILHLSTAPEKCHHTTLWNAELVHLIEVISFPWKMDGFENSQLLCCKVTWISDKPYYKIW